MKVAGFEVAASPRGGETSRLSVQVEVESQRSVLEYWFDFPTRLQPDLSDTLDWQAVLLLPLASYFDEPLRVAGPVDRQLADNLRGVSQLWSDWFEHCREVVIEAPAHSRVNKLDGAASGPRTLACFSGGIDSMFTLTRHHGRVTGDGDHPIDDVLSIAGFNTSMEDADYMFEHLEKITSRFGVELVPIVTNARYGDHPIETPYSTEAWLCEFAHGNLLAVFAHLFAPRYRQLIIPGTHGYGDLIPWGSHPLTDALLASSTLRIVHEGAAFSRVERTRVVAESDECLASMHVCWWDLADGNCGICEKCVRTMLTLDALGAKDRASAFDWSKYSMESVGRTYLKDENAVLFFLEVRKEAERLGRDDLVAAIDASIRFSPGEARRRRWKQWRMSAVDSNPVTRGGWQLLKKLAGRG